MSRKPISASSLPAVFRSRCVCGRIKRQAAIACQVCLDAADAARRAAEPPRMWARQWRARSWLCAFLDGRVYIALRNQSTRAIAGARSTPNDGGGWSLLVDPRGDGWTMLEPEDVPILERLQQISRDCYCASFPDSGCDFCNGTRLPDGAKEI